MKGGHTRSGRVAFNAPTRATHGTKKRARHRGKVKLGSSMIVCDPPTHLTPSQRKLWAFFAPQLVAEGRLPLKARDVLAKYVIAIDVVARLNKGLKTTVPKGNEKPILTELRQWLLVSRLYESDLLLSPAAAVRAPVPDEAVDSEDQELADIIN